MECTCEFSAGLDDWTEVISESWPTARKKHICYECGRDITPGEKYKREFCAGDGPPQTFKTCSDCMSIRENLVNDFFYGGVLELVSENIRDCFGDVPERCIAALTPAALAWVCEEIESVWEDDDDDDE